MTVPEPEQPPQANAPTSEWECGMCGRDGGPDPGCQLCSGAERFRQQRNFTLTEERQGKAPDDGRYDRTGGVNPKIVVLPGGFDPRQGNGG